MQNHFDKLLTQHECTADTARMAKLRLRDRPERRLLLGLPRGMNQVDRRLVDVFRQLVAGEAPWPLLLHGAVGTGKTRAALCLADFADTAAYHSVDSLADFTMQRQPGEVAAEWERLAGKALVILDELAQRRTNELTYSVVKRMLDEREFHAGNIAIYITNLEPAALAEVFDDRVFSRLTAGTVFHLNGPDRRHSK